MAVVEGGFEAQMKQVLSNLTAIVEASGSSLDKVVKTTVSLPVVPGSCIQDKPAKLINIMPGIPQVDGRLCSYECYLRFSF